MSIDIMRINIKDLQILQEHFEGCVKFWAKVMNKNVSELEPMIEAYREIPEVNPFRVKPEKLDEYTVEVFKDQILEHITKLAFNRE